MRSVDGTPSLIELLYWSKRTSPLGADGRVGSTGERASAVAARARKAASATRSSRRRLIGGRRPDAYSLCIEALPGRNIPRVSPESYRFPYFFSSVRPPRLPIFCREYVREHGSERPRDAAEVERVDQQHSILELPVPHEASQLFLDRPFPVRGLLLVGAESLELPLRREHFLHRGRAERAGQLVLEVDVARVEAKRLEVGAGEGRAEAGSLEAAPEVPLLRGVVEARETETKPRWSVPLEKATDVPVAAD
jgi:hypothetical protein